MDEAQVKKELQNMSTSREGDVQNRNINKNLPKGAMGNPRKICNS